MITKLIMDLFIGVPTWLIGLLPTFTAPTWVTSFDGFFGTLAEWMGWFDAYVPREHALIAITFVLACVGIAFVIKMTRIVASFFTLGGGSAA